MATSPLRNKLGRARRIPAAAVALFICAACAFSVHAKDAGNALVVQPDGKIIVVGSGATGDMAVARYHPDGGFDASFGIDGKVLTDFSGGFDEARAVTLQGDGKIVVAGFAEIGAGDRDFAVARYLPDGRLDPDFGTEGKLTYGFGRQDEYGASVSIQPDGRVVVAGTSAQSFALLRFHPDGSLDASFGTNGVVTTQFLANHRRDVARSMVLQDDGKILVAGRTDPPDQVGIPGYSYFRVALARYLSDGSLDSSFGDDGKVEASVPGVGYNGVDMVLQPDGKIIVSDDTNGPASVLARFLPGGSLDQAFGTGGTSSSALRPGKSVALQADGKIVVAGSPRPLYYLTSLKTDFHIARYHPDGSLDTEFQGLADFSGGDDEVSQVLIQADGKILVAGSSDNDFALARFESDGSSDAGFDRDGKVVTDFDHYQPDNQIRAKGGERRGADIYNVSGIGQTIRVANRRGHSAGFQFFVGNDGTDTDFPTARASRRQRNVRVRYFRVDPNTERPPAFQVYPPGPSGRGNVTAQLTGGGLYLGRIKSGQGVARFEARIRSRKGRIRFSTLEITASSEKAPLAKDTVRALVILGK